MSRLGTRGFTVNLFLPDADPEGLRVVEKTNWNGRGLVFPKAMFTQARSRKELTQTGVYVLAGPSETGSLPTIYVGEGDPVGPRLDEHFKKKAFWQQVVIFTSKDAVLNKAHVQRLEARLVELARDAKRCKLDNGNTPRPPSLSEADEDMVEGFLDNMLLCLPILGYSAFQRVSWDDSQSPVLTLRGKSITARARETATGFVVEKGSGCVGDSDLAPKYADYMRELRMELIAQGVMVRDGECYRLTQDYVFSSPSLAAGILLGNSVNGLTAWKTASGKALKETKE
jgi:hypothetical protein